MVSLAVGPLVGGRPCIDSRDEKLMSTIDLSWASWGRRSNVVLEEISIEGDQGYIAMDAESKLRLESAHHSQSLGPYASQYPEFYVESFSQTEQHFCDCLREGSDFETSGRDNLKTLGITLKAYRFDGVRASEARSAIKRSGSRNRAA